MNLESDLVDKKKSKNKNPNKLTIELSAPDNSNILATDADYLNTDDPVLTLGSPGSGRKGNPLADTNDNIDEDEGIYDANDTNDQLSIKNKNKNKKSPINLSGPQQD